MERKPKYFKDDVKNAVRQVSILPEDFPFRTLHSIANLHFRTFTEMECVIIGPKGKSIITPEYIRSVQALPYELTMDHILKAAIAMRRASSIHIIYKATAKNY